MAAARDTDVIRLTLPADQDMVGVLAVAVKVVGIRSGLTDGELDAARDATSTAFAELVGRTRARSVVAELEVTATEAWLHLSAGKYEANVALQRGA